MFWQKKVESRPKVKIEEVSMSVLNDIEVAAGYVVKLTHPVTAEVLKVFRGGEKIIEKDWNLVEGWFEQNAPQAVKVTKVVPNVTVEPQA